jgi:hypothetical protein
MHYEAIGLGRTRLFRRIDADTGALLLAGKKQSGSGTGPIAGAPL